MNLTGYLLTAVFLGVHAQAQQALSQDSPKENAVRLLSTGQDESRQGNLSAAMADLQGAVALDPQNAEAVYQLGLLFGQIGDFRAAEAASRHAIELKPDFAEAHYSLGLCLVANPQSKLDWAGAIVEFREAIKYRPNYAEAHNLLGAGLTHQSDFDAAIAELQIAIKLKPYLPDAHFNLAIALQRKDQLEKARTEYEAAIAAKGNYPEASVALGKLYVELGKPVDAERALREALKENPDLSDAHYVLARVLRSAGKTSEADIEIRIAKDLAQRPANAIESAQLSNQALQAAGNGSMKEAENGLRRAILLKPDYGIAHYNLALILADKKDFPGALHELTNAISLMSAEGRPWLEVARILDLAGQINDAMVAVSMAAHLSPSDPAIRKEAAELQKRETSGTIHAQTVPLLVPPKPGDFRDTPEQHIQFAKISISRNDAPGATGQLLRALSLRPNDAATRRQLASVYEILGDADHAELEYYKALDCSPDDVDTRVALGHLLLRENRNREAAEQFRQALDLRPRSQEIESELKKTQQPTTTP